MTPSTSMSLAEAEAHLSEVVSRVGTQHERVLVTVHGTPSAVLIARADLEALEETIAVRSDGDVLARPTASEAERAAVSESPRATSPRPGQHHCDRHGARRGTYRVNYRIDQQHRRVSVLDVAHRLDAYRARSRRSRTRFTATSRRPPRTTWGSLSGQCGARSANVTVKQGR